MAEPLTAEELEILADLQARQRAAEEAAELDDIQFRDAGGTVEYLPPVEGAAPLSGETTEFIDNLQIPETMDLTGMGAGPRRTNMDMTGMGAGRRENLMQRKAVPDAYKMLEERAANELSEQDEDFLPPE